MFRPSSATLALFLLAMTSLQLGCSDAPDRDWANTAYDQQKPLIDEIEAGLTKEFKAFAPVPYTEYPKDSAEHEKFTKDLNRRREAFDKAAMSLLEGQEKLIGWEITYAFPESESPPIPYSFDKTSDHKPAWKPGTVRAAKRPEKKAHRSMSWGEYLIRGKEKTTKMGLETSNYQSGLEVDFDIIHEKARLDVRLFIVPEIKE